MVVVVVQAHVQVRAAAVTVVATTVADRVTLKIGENYD